MIELPEPIAYQGRRYSTDADDPGWGTWITLSVDEVDHWKNLIAAGYKREVRELRTTDQLRTYGKACAAEAREQMRGECIAAAMAEHENPNNLELIQILVMRVWPWLGPYTMGRECSSYATGSKNYKI